MQRHRALQPGLPGAVPSASRRFLSKATDQCLRAHLPALPSWNRYLEAAFHSPETTACFQTTISRSKLPTCSFDTSPFVHPARSDSGSLTRSGSPRHAQDHCQKSRCLTPVRRSQPFLGSPLPFGAFRTLKDQSVQPDSWPKSSPSKRSR